VSATWDRLRYLSAPVEAGRSETDGDTSAGESSSVDWERLRTLLRSHGLCGYVDSESIAPAAPEVRDWLDDARREQTVRGLGLTETLYGARAVLEEAGVDSLPYKGPVTSVVAYDDVGTRAYADVDLLVGPDDFGPAREALVGAGYEQVERLRGLGEVALRDGRGHVVDLHRSILPRYLPYSLRFDEVWERRSTVDLGNGEVPALDPADRLVVSCVHGTKHCWYRLAWLRDLAALVAANHADDERVRERASALGCRRQVILGTWLADAVYDVTPPPWVERAVRSGDSDLKSVGESLLGRLRGGEARPPSDRDQFRVQWRTLSRWTDRAVYATRVATIPSDADVESVALPASLAPLYRAVRPVRLAVRYGRSRWSDHSADG